MSASRLPTRQSATEQLPMSDHVICNQEPFVVSCGPIRATSRMIADGKTSVAVTGAVLAQTRAVDAALNAFAHIAEASALEAAHAADAALQAGAAVGPLHGVPYSVKDLLDVAGMETGFGSELMRGNIASHDAVAVQRLRAAAP